MGGFSINGPGGRECEQGGDDRDPKRTSNGIGEKTRGKNCGLGPKTWCDKQNNGPQRYPYPNFQNLFRGKQVIFHGKKRLAGAIKLRIFGWRYSPGLSG